MNIRSYPGDLKAKETLSRYLTKTSLEEIKAAIMGSILAAEMVQPSRVLEMFGDAPAYESIEHAREHMGIVMALWNKLASHQTLKNPFRFSQIPDLKADDKDGWIEFCHLRESEITFFLRGIYAGDTPSAGELIEPTREDLLSYLPFQLEIGRKALAKHREEIEHGKSSLPPGMLGALALNIDEIYLSLYDDFLKQTLLWRKEQIKELRNANSVVRPEPKIGRNDPCPCGSGRKFKQCCLH